MTGTAVKPRRRWPWIAGGLLALLLALLAGGLAWLWLSPAATQQLLRHVPGLAAEGVHGRATGGPFSAERLVWERAGLRVVVEGLAWRDLRWRWRPQPGTWTALSFDELRARRIDITTTPGGEASSGGPPQDLRLPVDVAAPGLRVDALRYNDHPPLSGMRADVTLGAEGGERHRVDALRFVHEALAVHGAARIGAGAPLPVEADVQVATAAREGPRAWSASVRASGPLSRLAVSGALRAVGDARATLSGTVAPFARWPLPALEASLQRLDLSAFAEGLPQTALSGRASLAEGPTAGAPLSVRVALDNGAPGPWDAGRVPLRELAVVLRGRPEALGTLRFEALDATLGGEAAAAGHVRGEGQWAGETLTLHLALTDVRPDRLHTSAPQLTLSGRVDATLRGLLSPGASAGTPGATPAPSPGASAGAPGATPAPAGWSGDVTARLSGRLVQRGAPLALSAQATVAQGADGSLRTEIPSLALSAGAAQAQARVLAERSAAGEWHATSTGKLARLDPGAWWPTVAGGGRSEVNAQWEADVTWPAGAGADFLDAVRGDARVAIGPSRLAGVPLQGSATLHAKSDVRHLDADLRSGRNAIRVNGRVNPRSAWDIVVEAPALAELAPLARLWPAAPPAWLPRGGALSGRATVAGSWPDVVTEGTLRAESLHLAALRLGRGHVRWQLDTSRAEAPLSLDVDAHALVSGDRRVERLQVQASGSRAAHRVQLTARSPLRPPAWAEAAAGTRANKGSVLEAALHGTWRPAAAGGGEWRGTLTRLRGAPVDGTRAWLAASDVTARVRLGPDHAPREVALAPGRLNVLGAGLRWQQAHWQAAAPGGAPRVDLQAVLEPLRVAPLLAPLWPQGGLRGDLTLGGRVTLRSTPALHGEVVLERRGGDLEVALQGVHRPLGLTRLNVELTARDGRWHFTQQLAGARTGTWAGEQTVRTGSPTAWPDATSALSGHIDLRVPDVGTWSPWLPVGWRASGAVQASAQLAGTLGAPRYDGRITGQDLAVRNVFEGIRLHDGTLDVALRGETLDIRTLRFRSASGGELRITGAARLGAQPSATLHVVAQQFRALDRVDRRVTVSGQADVALDHRRVAITGGFDVDRGLIDVSQGNVETLDEDVVVLNREPLPGERRPDPAGRGTSPMALALDLRIGLGEHLRLQGRGLDTLLSGRLRVTSSDEGELRMTGVVRTEQGTYSAYGQNLAIERGTLTFTGNLANPLLDVRAVRADIDVPRVGVMVTGHAVDPRVRLYSEPDMPEFETLTWLVLGREPAGLGRDDTALLQRAALALVAGERGSGAGGIAQRLGLDEISLRRAESGNVGDTVVSLGKQLSERVYVGYEHALSAAGGTWELVYRIAGKLMLRAQAGDDSGIDAIWSWRWN